MTSAPAITETVNIEGVTISQVIWRRFKRQPSGYIERVIELNPGISLDVILPVGTVLNLPLDLPEDVPTTNVVRLWD